MKQCDQCSLSFKTSRELEFHLNICHRCKYCEFTASTLDVMEHEYSHTRNTYDPTLQAGGGSTTLHPYPFKEITAFKGYCKAYRYRNTNKKRRIMNTQLFFKSFKTKMLEILDHAVNHYNSIKCQFSLLVKFRRAHYISDKDDDHETTEQYFNSNQKIVLSKYYTKSVYKMMLSDLELFVEFYEKNGSGWVVEEIKGCDIRIAEFAILRAGCYINIPNIYAAKGAIVNPKNSGTDCFVWAFLICMHSESGTKGHRDRIKPYERFKPLYDWSEMEFPASIMDIKRFEKKNQNHSIAINVFGIDSNNTLNIIYHSIFVRERSHKVVNILYVQNTPDSIGHFMSIMNFSRLLNTANNHKKMVCYNCLNVFSEKRIEPHRESCYQFRTQKIGVPSVGPNGEEPVCEFETKHLKRKLKANYIIIADFEAILPPKTDDDDPGTLHTHDPSGFFLVALGPDGKIVDSSLRRGKDCMDVFMRDVEKLSAHLLRLNKIIVPMLPLTDEELDSFESATTCHICELPFLNTPKVKDHNHNTGFYRAAACRSCNANYIQGSRIPVIMHNWRNYDSHLLLNSHAHFGNKVPKVIPSNSEKFTSIFFPTFYFVDSFLHLPSSLDKMVTNLHSKPEEFESRFAPLIEFFGIDIAKKLSRKGVYPYEFMDSWDKFNERKFPRIDKFYSSLSGKSVSHGDYKFGKEIFEEYCTDLGEYHDLYMVADVLLLASVFQNYRKVAITHFKLDPVYYLSLPGYSWHAALFFTKVVLTLITDQDMYNMMELGLRGGVSMITTRYAAAHNKYMEDYVKGAKDDSYIFYVDRTNLYGESLTNPLPVGDFSWETRFDLDKINKEEILSWQDDDEMGRILEVDLIYPAHLHLDSAHNEYSLAPERTSVPLSSLSPYQTELIDHLNIHYSEKQTKLIPHLGDRKKYVLHYRCLKFYLEEGMELVKVHRSITFSQRPWLKEFILFTTNLRRNAVDVFETNLFKLVNNSIFGKSMEQVRNRQDAFIVNTVEKAKYYTRRSNFIRFDILGPNCIIVFMQKAQVILNKPIYTALTVLDISKLLMYIWHYRKMKAWYGAKAKFLFTDTDSLAYHIQTEDLYADLEKHQHEFDFSDYKEDHPLYSPVNRKILGTMKDEAGGKIFRVFVGFAPKVYIFTGEDVLKVADKGVKRSLVEEQATPEIFLNALFGKQKYGCGMNLIRSKRHKLSTMHQDKSALHCFDNKRYILEDGIKTLAHGHFLISHFNGN